MSFLEVDSLGRQLQHTWILRSISFGQLPLQNIAIAGETGSGKSTLLRMIAGLAQPQEGSIHFEGERVQGSAEKLIPGHPGIAYLSQVYELPKFLRVEQVLQYASKISVAEAQRLFDICRITHLLTRRTDELSGGEQQRIALARLLVMRPRLLLLDEPFSNLDLIHKTILKKVLDEAQQQLQLSLILTSHDPQDTLGWADAIGVMKDGAMLQWGTPEQVYRQPENEYVAGLFGKYNLLSGDAAAALLPGIPYHKEGTLLIRPEAFREGKDGVTALVKSVRFAGSFYEIHMWIEDQLLTMYSRNGSLEKGSRIRVALQPQDAWKLKD